MGNPSTPDDDNGPFPPRRDGETEWECERSKFVAGWGADRLAKMVRLATIRTPINGHAYSLDEIARLRNLVARDKMVWSDEALYRHTDELAVLVGLRIRTERQIEASDRVADIQSRLVKPTEALLGTLRDQDFSNEFLAPWGRLKEIDADSLVVQLETLIEAAHAHIRKIKAAGAQAKRWDSYLKDYFINIAAILCEYINPDFEPTKKSLSGPAYLLAKPLFADDPKIDGQFLDWKIRQYRQQRTRAPATLQG